MSDSIRKQGRCRRQREPEIGMTSEVRTCGQGEYTRVNSRGSITQRIEYRDWLATLEATAPEAREVIDALREEIA